LAIAAGSRTGRRPSELERLSTQVRYRRHILDLEIDHEMLRVSSRPFTAAA
jgi:Glycosyl hydrolase family 65, C-terminal domain